MLIGLLKDIADLCPDDVRLLGMDVGAKTIGLAVGDVARGVATPLQTIKRRKFRQDMVVLSEVIQDYDVGGFIIGLPLSMDSSEGRRAQSVREMIKPLVDDPTRLKAEGRADAEPIESNDTKEGRAANRRIEFVFVRQGNDP